MYAAHMQYFILKTEPHAYSFEQLEKDKKTSWDGVRNFQARNNLSSMHVGDLCMIYHSVGPKEIVGTAVVTKEADSDKTSPDGRWVAVEIGFKSRLEKPVHLEQLKNHDTLKDIQLVRQSRLSVCPIAKKDWDAILQLAKS